VARPPIQASRLLFFRILLSNFVTPTLDPTGNFIYIVQNNDNAVYGYSIDKTTCYLTALSGFPVGVDNNPDQLQFVAITR